EGKFYGWTMVVVLFIIYFIIGGVGIYGPSTVNGLMLKETGMSRSIYGWGFLGFNLFQGLIAPWVAKVINTKGIKTSLLMGGGFLALTGLLLGTVIDVTKYPWLFVAVFGIVAGFAIGFGGPVPAQTGVNLWFNKKRALAMSIVLSASGVGGFVVAPTMTKIAAASGGHYKPVWLVVAGAAVIAMVITALFVKNKPEELGQVPDGRIYEDTGVTKVSRVYKAKVAMEPAKALRHPKMWFIALGLYGVFFPYMFGLAHSMPHILDHGFTPAQAAMAIGLMPFCSIAGRLTLGFLGDYVEPRYIWFVGAISMIIGFYFLMIASTYTHLVLYAIFMGVGFGTAFVSYPTLLGNYFGGATFPSLMAVVFPLMQLVGAIAPGLGGAIFDRTGSYQLFFYIGFVSFAIALVSILLASPPKVVEESAVPKTIGETV
ncbi:MAG TPA: MFS transporter, partial [Bacillota bacterium]|nr:MFS transporter [Bacillota bacterium]